jgi:DNA replication protein DnaC
VSTPQSFDELLGLYRDKTPEERDAVRREAEARLADERAVVEMTRKIESARKLSDLGARFATRTLERYQVPPGDADALRAALEFVDDPEGKGLWYIGPVGVGKSHLCAGVVIACNDLAIAGTFKTAPGFLDAIKSTFDREGKLKHGESDIIGALARVPVLVLDDIDKVDFTGWASQKFYALVNSRYEANLPLLATSNTSPADLALRWSERGLDPIISVAIIDRMCEMCTMVPVRGESYRQRGVA